MDSHSLLPVRLSVPMRALAGDPHAASGGVEIHVRRDVPVLLPSTDAQRPVLRSRGVGGKWTETVAALDGLWRPVGPEDWDAASRRFDRALACLEDGTRLGVFPTGASLELGSKGAVVVEAAEWDAEFARLRAAAGDEGEEGNGAYLEGVRKALAAYAQDAIAVIGGLLHERAAAPSWRVLEEGIVVLSDTPCADGFDLGDLAGAIRSVEAKGGKAMVLSEVEILDPDAAAAWTGRAEEPSRDRGRILHSLFKESLKDPVFPGRKDRLDFASDVLGRFAKTTTETLGPLTESEREALVSKVKGNLDPSETKSQS